MHRWAQLCLSGLNVVFHKQMTSGIRVYFIVPPVVSSVPAPGGPPVGRQVSRQRRRRPQRSASQDQLDDPPELPRDFDERAYLAGRVPLISERDYTAAPAPEG